MDMWHITFRTEGRNPLVAGEQARRVTVYRLAPHVRDFVVLFSLVDEHIHLVLSRERVKAGNLAQALHGTLRPLLSTPLDPARIRPVESRSHMERLLGYILKQPAHHGLAESPALWTGSCFLDLAGARFINGVSLQITKALPRFRLRDAYACVGLPSVKVEPYGPDKVRAVGAHKLRDAAAAVLCVGPELDGKWEPVVWARAAVCRLARQAGISTPEVTDALGLSLHGVRYLATLDLPDGERILRCVMQRLALEEVVRRG